MTTSSTDLDSVAGGDVQTGQPVTSPKPKRRWGLIVLIVVWVVALVLGGVGLWWHFAGKQPRAAFTSAPQVTRVVDLSLIAPDSRQVPVTAGHEFLRSDTMRVHRLRSDAGDVLVGVDQETQTTFPTWVAPITDGPETECLADADSVTCGSQTFLLADGTVTAVVASSSGDSDESADGGETNQQRAGDTPSSDAQASSEQTKAGQSGGGDASGQNAGSGQAAGVAVLPTVRLMADSGSDGGFTVDEAGHLNQGSTTVNGIELAGGSAWGIPASGNGENSEGFWFICDGTTLVGVEDGNVIWTKDLDESSVTLNSFDQEVPAWFASVAVVVIADRTGIHAYSAEDGSELWTLEAEVESWSHDGDEISLSTGQTLATARFTPDAGNSASQSGPGTITAPEPATPILTDEEILNSTLETPYSCTGGYDQSLLEFSDGKSPDELPYVEIKQIQRSVIDGAVVNALSLSCTVGASSTWEIFTLYDSELNLIGSVADNSVPEDDFGFGDIPFDSPGFFIDTATIQGRYIHLKTPTIFKLTGDDEFRGGEYSGFGDIVYQFDGEHFNTQQATITDQRNGEVVWSLGDQVNTSAQQPEPEPLETQEPETPTGTPQERYTDLFTGPVVKVGGYEWVSSPSGTWACTFGDDYHTLCRPNSGKQGLIPSQQKVLDESSGKEGYPNLILFSDFGESGSGNGSLAAWLDYDFDMDDNVEEYMRNFGLSQTVTTPGEYGNVYTSGSMMCTFDPTFGAVCARNSELTHGFQVSTIHVETW